VFAFVFRKAFEIDAFVIDGSVDFEAVFLAGIKIVGAVSWSSVDDAAALIEGDVASEDAGDLERQKGMMKFHAFEVAAFVRGEDASFLDAGLRLQSGDAIGGEKEFALFGFDDGVFEIGME